MNPSDSMPPSPAEAWADVLTASRMVPASFCHAGTALLLDAVEFLDCGDVVRFIHILKKSILHDSTCPICCLAHREEVYCHPFVELTVKRLGGYDALFTGDPMVAEARFLEAYESLLDEQQKKGGVQPEPACGHMDDRRLLLEISPGKWLHLPAPPRINTTLN